MGRILLAGATGHLGAALIPALAARGDDVVALVRQGSASRLGRNAEVVAGVRAGDLLVAGSLPSTLEGIDTIVSTVGMTTPVRGITPMDLDYGGNLALLEAARAAGVGRFVYVSVAGVDRPGALDVPVVAAKARFEQALMASDMAWSIARPSGFFWNYGIFLTTARKHSMIPIIGDGTARSTPVAEDDLAAAIADRLEADGSVYSVGGPEDLSANEIAEMIHRVLAKRVRALHVPVSITRGAIAALRPFNRGEADMAQFFAWAMTAEVTADHVGHTSLESWMRAHRDEDFTT